MGALLMDAQTRRFSRQGNGAERSLRLTQYESLAVAQVEPPRLELSRAGARFGGGCQAVASGIANVTDFPTTTAALALYNGESDGGKCYVIERIVDTLGSGTAAAGKTVLGCVTTKIAAASIPTAASNYSTQSLSNGGDRSKAIWGTAVTIPAGSAWMALYGNNQSAAANVGMADGYWDFDGALIVPPGCALGLSILTGAGTSPKYSVSIIWVELQLDLE